MKKQELIDQNAGRRHALLWDGVLNLHLPISWTKAEIEDAIALFESRVAADKYFRESRDEIESKLNAHHYTLDEVRENKTARAILDAALMMGQHVEQIVAEILPILRKDPNAYQVATLRELGWSRSPSKNKLTHLFCSGEGSWIASDCQSIHREAILIHPNGRHETLPASELETFDKKWNDFKFAEVIACLEIPEKPKITIVGKFGESTRIDIYPFGAKEPGSWESCVLLKHQTKMSKEDDSEIDSFKFIRQQNIRGGIEYTSKMNQAEAIALKIAKNFHSFILNPYDWISCQVNWS